MRKFKSVHDAHCCVIHGCKYGDSDCPVVLGEENGIECEECETTYRAGIASYRDFALEFVCPICGKYNFREVGLITEGIAVTCLDCGKDLKLTIKVVLEDNK